MAPVGLWVWPKDKTSGTTRGSGWKHHVVGLHKNIFVHGIGAHGRQVHKLAGIRIGVAVFLPGVAKAVAIRVTAVVDTLWGQQKRMEVALIRSGTDDLSAVIDGIRPD